MPRKKSEKFELFDGANELFRRLHKGEISQSEFRERMRPVRRVMKLYHKLLISWKGIIRLDGLHKKGKVTDAEFTEQKKEWLQNYKQTEKEAWRMIKAIRKNAAKKF